MTTLTDDMRRAMRNAAEVMEEQARSAETRLVGAETDPDCDEQTVSVLRREAAKWREPAEALRNALASRSSSGSGEREARVEAAVQAMHLAVGVAMKFETFRRRAKTAAEVTAEADRSLRLEADAERAIRALSSAPPSPDSGDSETP